MNEHDDLRKCPFCEGNGILTVAAIENGTGIKYYCVICSNCGITVQGNPYNKFSLESAILKWNTRYPDPPATDEEIRKGIVSLLLNLPNDLTARDANLYADRILALLRPSPASEQLRRDAVLLRNCLRALTDGTGDGDGQLIQEGRDAVESTSYLDSALALPPQEIDMSGPDGPVAPDDGWHYEE